MTDETKAATEKFDRMDWAGINEQNAQVANAITCGMHGIVPKDGRWYEFRTFLREADDYVEICGTSLVLAGPEDPMTAIIKSVDRQANAKLQTIRTLIEEEEWNADFREVLLAELGREE